MGVARRRAALLSGLLLLGLLPVLPASAAQPHAPAPAATAKLRGDLAARGSDLGAVAEGTAKDVRKRAKALAG